MSPSELLWAQERNFYLHPRLDPDLRSMWSWKACIDSQMNLFFFLIELGCSGFQVLNQPVQLQSQISCSWVTAERICRKPDGRVQSPCSQEPQPNHGTGGLMKMPLSLQLDTRHCNLHLWHYYHWMLPTPTRANAIAASSIYYQSGVGTVCHSTLIRCLGRSIWLVELRSCSMPSCKGG